MEQILVIAIVILAAGFVAKRFSGFLKASKFSGPGCCGGCGCKTSESRKGM